MKLLRGALARRNSPLERDLDGRGNEHDRDDLDQIAGEERNDTGSQGSGQGHSGLSYEPSCAENVENGSGEEHRDKHCGVFTDAGSISSVEVVEKTCDEGHGDVSDNVAAGDAEGRGDACRIRRAGPFAAARWYRGGEPEVWRRKSNRVQARQDPCLVPPGSEDVPDAVGF